MAGIYIHIPFCKKACTYCNFHFSTQTDLKMEMISAIIKEIELQNDFIPLDEPIETIYFGGGTPSLLTSDELNKMLETIHQKFKVNSNIEMTLEANPDDISLSQLKSWKSIGVNRLSLGIQTFNEEELKWMHRAHDAETALSSIDQIFEAGIHNFSVDLIFGSSLSSHETLIKNLEIITSKNIPHLSCYALTVEPKTLLHQLIEKEKTQRLDAEKQAEHFLTILDFLNENGYEQYEISNYSKPGMRSKHNSSYWQGKPYYGFGPSAHSFDGKNIRRWNIANNPLYIKKLNQDEIYFEEEVLTATQQINEYIMTSLRTIEGIDLRLIEAKFDSTYKIKLLSEIQKYQRSGKIEFENNTITLTREGKLFADGIAADLFF